jgi:hypothetical protein
VPGRLVVTRKFLEMLYTSSAVFAKTPPKIDHRLLGSFLQALMIEFPALSRNSQQKGKHNVEYFNHRSRGLLNGSRGV